MTTTVGRWTEAAACARADRDPTWWDPDVATPDQLRLAATICSGCPVRLDCAEDAETDQPHGAQVRAGRVYGYRGSAGENPPLVRVWLGRPRPKTRECDYCGNPFEPTRPDRKHCSTRCGIYAHRERNPRVTESPERPTQSCWGCGVPFTSRTRQARYCSAVCKKTAKYQRERERRGAA